MRIVRKLTIPFQPGKKKKYICMGLANFVSSDAETATTPTGGCPALVAVCCDRACPELVEGAGILTSLPSPRAVILSEDYSLCEAAGGPGLDSTPCFVSPRPCLAKTARHGAPQPVSYPSLGCAEWVTIGTIRLHGGRSNFHHHVVRVVEPHWTGLAAQIPTETTPASELG